MSSENWGHMQLNNASLSLLQQIFFHNWTLCEHVVLRELLKPQTAQRWRKKHNKQTTTMAWFCFWDLVKRSKSVLSSNRCIRCFFRSGFSLTSCHSQSPATENSIVFLYWNIASSLAFWCWKRDRPVAFSKVNICYNYTKAGRDGKLESSGQANDAI